MPFINMHVLFPTVEPSQPETMPAKRLPGDVAELEDEYLRTLQKAMKGFEDVVATLEVAKRMKVRAIKLRAMQRALENAQEEIGELEHRHEKTGK